MLAGQRDVRGQGGPRDLPRARHRRPPRHASARRDGHRAAAPAAAPPCARGARIVERTPTVTQFVNDMKHALSKMGAFPDRDHRRRMPSESTETLSTPLATRQHPNAQLEEAPPVPPQHDRDGRRDARLASIEVDDRLDLAVPTTLGVDARVRAHVRPEPDGYRVNVKGLNCFVARDGRPAAAVLLERDGTVELMSSTREPMGRISLRVRRGFRAQSASFQLLAPSLVLPLHASSARGGHPHRIDWRADRRCAREPDRMQRNAPPVPPSTVADRTRTTRWPLPLRRRRS